jgi:hypothetical protein
MQCTDSTRIRSHFVELVCFRKISYYARLFSFSSAFAETSFRPNTRINTFFDIPCCLTFPTWTVNFVHTLQNRVSQSQSRSFPKHLGRLEQFLPETRRTMVAKHKQAGRRCTSLLPFFPLREVRLSNAYSSS